MKKPEYAQEVMLRISWSCLIHQDDQPAHTRRGEVMCDLGLDGVPTPEFTSEEMQEIAFAAKGAALEMLRRRAVRKQHSPLKPGDTVLYFCGAKKGWVKREVLAVTKKGNPKIIDPISGVERVVKLKYLERVD